MTKKVACFDVGGTYVKYGIVDEGGSILQAGKVKTPGSNCSESIPSLLTELVLDMSKHHILSSIGISTAGNVDTARGEIIFASGNLPGYTGTRLGEAMRAQTGLQCFVENDVNAIALGEGWIGAGKELDDFVCVALGTGIGGAIITDRRLHRGHRYGAGELGHMVIQAGGRSCKCGAQGCYEAYASTSALVREYAQASGMPEESVTGRLVFERVTEGDVLAIEVYQSFLNHVTTGLVNIAHILDPGVIVIGGGVSEAGQGFINDMNRRLLDRLMPSYRHTRIVGAKLGNNAGLVGVGRIAVHGA